MSQATLYEDVHQSTPKRPSFLERLQLLSYCIRYLRILQKQPERTECIFLLRAYADILLPGRHLEHCSRSPEPLTPISVLKTLPESSLGRLYADYMGTLLVDDAGLEIYEQKALEQEEAAARALRERFFDVRRANRHRALTNQHDLYHLLTGYNTSVINEICLQTFQFAQVGSGLTFFIGPGGILRRLKHGQWKEAKQIWLGFLRGKRAKLLLFTDWNQYWDRPIAEVRSDLNL
jgi:ubiquinone biosynthesis protein Coq4